MRRDVAPSPLIGSRCGPFAMVLKLLEMRRVSVSGLITHRFPLAQAGEGKAVRDEPRERGCTQNHELRALESICKDAGYSTNLKMVLTSATAARISKSSTCAWDSRRICWWTGTFFPRVNPPWPRARKVFGRRVYTAHPHCLERAQATSEVSFHVFT